MTEVALITGASGMAGAHLIRHLWATCPEIEVHALVRSTSRSRVLSSAEWDKVHKHIGDLLDAEGTARIVEATRPSFIYHLGAQSFVGAHDAGASTFAVNGLGTLHVLDAARKVPGVRVLVTGSSEEYGKVSPMDVPINEGHSLNVMSHYAVSKVAADLFGQLYWRSFKLHVVRARAFNNFGPGRDDRFFEGSMCTQIARIEAGLQQPVIRHGSLDAVRDYSDTRDVVRAYRLLLEHGVPGTAYNVASGKGHRTGDVLDTLIAMAKVKGIRKEQDPVRLRPSDVPLLIGDAARILAVCDWRPEIPFEKSLADLLDWHRAVVARG